MPTLQELGVPKAIKLLTEHHPDGTERWITVTPAYDLRHSEPKQNYGIHGCEMVFGIKRGEVTIILRWMTDFHLKSVRQELETRTGHRRFPDGLGEINYHSPVALYEGQHPVEDCHYTGGKCYCDGSGIAASDLFEKFVRDPSVLWGKLISWLEDTESRVKAMREAERMDS